jgi:Flp pilus assembly protein TadD
MENKAQEVRNGDPDYVPALMVLALAQEQQRNRKGAVPYYETIRTLFPLFAPATKNLAILYFDSGDEAKAFGLARKARESIKADPALDKIAGIEAYQNGQFDETIRLLGGCERDPIVLFYLGLAHSKLNNSKEAKQFLNKALELHALDPKKEEKARIILRGMK